MLWAIILLPLGAVLYAVFTERKRHQPESRKGVPEDLEGALARYWFASEALVVVGS